MTGAGVRTECWSSHLHSSHIPVKFHHSVCLPTFLLGYPFFKKKSYLRNWLCKYIFLYPCPLSSARLTLPSRLTVCPSFWNKHVVFSMSFTCLSYPSPALHFYSGHSRRTDAGLLVIQWHAGDFISTPPDLISERSVFTFYSGWKTVDTFLDRCLTNGQNAIKYSPSPPPPHSKKVNKIKKNPPKSCWMC